MAAGIVEVFAKAGYEVTSVTRGAEKSGKLLDDVKTSLNKAVVRGKLTEEERDAALGLITWSGVLDDLADVDLVVEAVVEELSVKKALFESLDEICKPGVVFATTTSSLPVIECAMATGRPADVVGLHFFNPAPVMPLIEVVRTIRTSAEALATAKAVCEKLGKTPVVCADRSGFVVNALLFPYLNDAVKMLEASYSTADDIDYAMKLGCGYPDGPVRTARRRRSRCRVGHPARALPGVPGARVRTGPAARTSRHGRLPRPQGRPRIPRLRPFLKISRG